eukprot:COSAG01_NODE_1716_length_9403_cov_4.038697_7_plen_699_part_00
MFFAYWIFLTVASVVFLFALILLLDTIFSNSGFTEKNANDVGPQGPTLRFTVDNNVPSSTLQLFEQFYQNNMLEGKMNDLVGVSNVPLYLLPSLKVGPSNRNFQLCGVYDNALVTIFASQMGDGRTCTRICNTFLALMNVEGYIANEATSAARIGPNFSPLYGGLYQRYSIKTGRHVLEPQENLAFPKAAAGSESEQCTFDSNRSDYFKNGLYQTSDNAFVGISFCRVVLQFHMSLPSSTLQFYINAALDQFNVIVLQHACPLGNGFFSNNETQTLLTSDHAAIFALGNLLMTVLKTLPLQQEIELAKNNIQNVMLTCQQFSQKMFNNRSQGNQCFPQSASRTDEQYYFLGTRSCNEEIVCTGVPMFAQTWPFLSNVSTNKDVRIQSINWAQTACNTQDTDADPKGCGPNSPRPCSTGFFDPSAIFYGYLFSDQGSNIQWESTASMFMANYARFSESTLPPEEQQNLKGQVNNVLNSLVKLSNKYAARGIPQTFLAENNFVEGIPNQRNSGYDFGFWNHPSTAATMWVGMSLYLANSKGNQAYMPFNSSTTGVSNKNEQFVLPSWIDSIPSENRITCAFPSDIKFPSGTNCGPCTCTQQNEVKSESFDDVPKTISVYCEAFKNNPSSVFFNPDAGPFSSILSKLGVSNQAQFGVLCDSPFFSVCSVDIKAASLQNLYLDYTDFKNELPKCIKCQQNSS